MRPLAAIRPLALCAKEWPLLFGLRPRAVVVDIQGVTIGRRAVEQLWWRTQHRHESPVSLLLEPALAGPEEDGTEQGGNRRDE